jgi:hypothetical protein
VSDTSLVFNIIAKDKASKTFDKMKAGAALAGAAIGAALAAGVAGMMEKSKTDALLAAQLGAGPQMAAEFGKISGDLYAKGFGETAADVSNALKGVWQNGLVDEDAATADIERVTGRILTLGQVMTEDADRISSTVSQMIRTGMVKSAEEGFDLLARGTQQGINKSQDLLDVFNEYPTQFRKLGLDGPAAMGLLSQAIKAGARDSDTAADALKEFSIRAVDGSKTSAAGYKALGLDAKAMTAQMAAGGEGAAAGLDTVLDRLRAMKDPVAQSQAAVALFGTKAEDLGAALFSMDGTSAAAALGSVEGAAKKAGDTLAGSTGAKLEQFKRKAQMALVDTMAKAVPYIEGTFGFLARHKDTVIPIAVGLGALAVAIGVVVGAMKVYTAVQAALNIVMAMNPIALIVIGIMLLVGAVILAYNKVGWFRAGVQGAFNGIVAAGKWLWSGLQTVWRGLVTAFNWVVGVATGFARSIKANWNAIGAGATWLKNTIVGGFIAWLNFVRGIPGKIRSFASGMFDGIKNAFRSAINWIIGRWNGLSFGIPRIEIGGMSFGGKRFGVPKIPYLDTGGRITADGLAFVHKNETVMPAAQTAPLRGGAAGAAVVLEVRSGGSRLDDLLVEVIRNAVRVKGRGNVQIALGQN